MSSANEKSHAVVAAWLLSILVATHAGAVVANAADLDSADDQSTATETGAFEGAVAENPKADASALDVGVLLQVDATQYEGAYSAAVGGRSVTEAFLRRARLSANKRYGNWEYALLVDIRNDADFDSALLMARARYTGFGNGLRIDFGKIHEEVGLEGMTSSTHLSTMERSSVSRMFSPYFNWGVGMNQYFSSSGVRYAFGVHQAKGFGGSGKTEGSLPALATTARLTWAPVHKKGKVLHLGVWGSHRQFEDSTDSLVLRNREEVIDAENWLLDYSAGGSRYNVDHLDQHGMEIATVVGPFSAQAEYATRTVSASDHVNDHRYDGSYGMISVFLTGESRTYTRNATFTSPKPKHKYGAVELVVRHSQFDASSANQGTDVKTTTFGVNYYLGQRWRFMVNRVTSTVKGPGAAAIVGTVTDGDAYLFRAQFAY